MIKDHRSLIKDNKIMNYIMISKCKSSLKSLVSNKTIKTNNLTIFHKFPKNRNYMNKIRIIIKNNKNNLVFLKTNITKPLFNQSKININ